MSTSTPDSPKGRLTIETKAQLIEELACGAKPKTHWRIGTEHEKLPFLKGSKSPVPYSGPRSIQSMLQELKEHLGWLPVMEAGNIIGLSDPAGLANISLEAGGQLELSGSPLETLHDTCEELSSHLRQVREVGDKLGIGFIGIGASPLWGVEDTPIMPKERCGIMASYLPKVGGHGITTMLQTCTVQVNLDFSSEADMVKKLRVSLALQPIATALFANSPFRAGCPSGFLSYRSELWRDTDAARTGMLPFVFEDGMGFERYVDYALDVPMYFIRRDDKFIDTAGASFRQFLDGRLPQRPGERPMARDWSDHLSTIFPEVRLRKYLEMRGADCGPLPALCALPAFWVGLLYDERALDDAWSLVKDWSAAERQSLRDDIPKAGLHANIGGRRVRDIARDVLAIARKGLNARAEGKPESVFLEPLDEVVASGRTPAETLLDLYGGEWNGNIERLFDERAY